VQGNIQGHGKFDRIASDDGSCLWIVLTQLFVVVVWLLFFFFYTAYHEHGHDPANKRKCPCPIEAAVHGSVTKMKEALECGKKAELEPWNEQHTAAGDTPLMIAAMGGHNYLVRMLLEHGADPEIRNKGGTTALMRASARGRYETCRILIDEGGADAEAKDNHGHSVIMHAHIGHHEATERHLRRHIDERRRLKETEETTTAKSSEL
jgi:hypothetical protein